LFLSIQKAHPLFPQVTFHRSWTDFWNVPVLLPSFLQKEQ